MWTYELIHPSKVTETSYKCQYNNALPKNRLIISRGFDKPENNGLKVVGRGTTTRNIKVDGLIPEDSPPANATIQVCGIQCSPGDILVNDEAEIVSKTMNFETLGISVGGYGFLGDVKSEHRFTILSNFGHFKITGIYRNRIMTDNKKWVFDRGGKKSIRIFFAVSLPFPRRF